MPSSVGTWLLVVGGFILLSVARCDLNQNVTDCSDRSANVCSDFSFVGKCNETTGVCNCDLYNGTEPTDCFYNNPAENFCTIRDCYHFFNSSGRCREGSRSRLTALLLSLFLINFGAANFYIERFDLAVPQIILGLLLCVFQFGSCALSGKRDSDDPPRPACIICCGINSFLSLLFLFWWITDLIFFATNSRDDGDGCPLYT